MKKNPIMKYFSYAHLPAHLREISEPVCKLAEEMNAKLAPGAELSAGLRKLLEAKDCLVRAGLRQDDVGRSAHPEVGGGGEFYPIRGGEDEHVKKTGGES